MCFYFSYKSNSFAWGHMFLSGEFEVGCSRHLDGKLEAHMINLTNKALGLPWSARKWWGGLCGIPKGLSAGHAACSWRSSTDKCGALGNGVFIRILELWQKSRTVRLYEATLGSKSERGDRSSCEDWSGEHFVSCLVNIVLNIWGRYNYGVDKTIGVF